MKINVDLDNIRNLNLSPSEYCALIVIEDDSLFQYPIGDAILTSLKNKGWIDENNKLLKQIKEKEKIDTWIELWPTHVLPGGYRVSGNYYDCKTRMKTFIKKYGYSWDVIMEATKNYLLRQEAKNWQMTKKNLKFIYDMQGSILAEECDAVILGLSDGDIGKGNTLFM